MRFSNLSKNVLTLIMGLILVLGVMNFGSYNPHDELASFVPVVALAELDGPVLLTPPPLDTTTQSLSTFRSCNIFASTEEVVAGANLNISWQTQGFYRVTINGQLVQPATSGSITFNNIQENSTYTLVATTEDGKSNCVATVIVRCITPVLPPTCTLTPASTTINAGESVNLVWSTTNAASASLTDFGGVALAGNRSTGPLSTSKNYTLTVVGQNGNTVNCHSAITVKPPVIPAPTCTLTPASTTINAGESVNLVWSTTNAASASLTDFGGVALAGNRSTGPLSTSKNYTLTVVGQNGNTVNCHSAITVKPPVIPAPTCTLTPTSVTINAGESVTLQWSTTNAILVTLSGVGEVTTLGSKVVGPLSTSTTYTLTAYGADEREVKCLSIITVKPPVIPAPTCTLTPTSVTINAGESVNLVWSTTNAASASLTDFGPVALSGNRSTGPLSTSKNYTLTVVGQNGNTVNCHSTITVRETPPVPVCNLFTATPAIITKGGTSTLAWTTTNATRVVIDNAIGQVSASGTLQVSPLLTTEYTMTVFGTGEQSTSCKAKITVNDIPVTPVPKCESFSATPTTLPSGGGKVVLSWSTSNATGVSISPTIGIVALSGTTTATVSNSTTFTMTVSGVNNQSVSCPVTVTVLPPVPVPISCASNVNFSANPTKINRGGDATLTWTTTGLTAVSINQGITATGLSGSVSVSPDSTTTYTLTGTAGTSTIACPVTVSVETSGGGGGSSSPRCEISISKNKISKGESATLRWDTTRASDIEIVDSKDRVLITTKGLISKEKTELLDGTLKVSPTTDTKYTLTAKRGSREKVCIVSIDVENPIVVTQIRDQQPLVAGIALSQVPYTGFEAGPFLTLSFYALLLAWALYIAYVLVIRRDVLGGYALAGTHIVAETPTPEQIRPDVFVKSVSTVPRPVTSVVPAGLPVADKVIGYEALVGAANSTAENTEESVTTISSAFASDEVVTALENYAHAKKALLSSDAIRHFIGTTGSEEERFIALNDVITTAKEKYPAEDGWVVINEKRMRDLCVTCSVNQVRSSVAPYVPTVIPEGSGSLAEAIVTGNIVAAYEMIGHRPMFALADAAADLDSIYRSRKGEKMVISDMLIQSTTNLSDEQIIQMIKALTGALDGTYNDEESAVKMAIMKAVKVVA